MDEQKFEDEMLKAIMRRATQPERASYWKGVERGLQRAHYGAAFGTDDTIDSGCRSQRTAVMSRTANTGAATATGWRSPSWTPPFRPRRST